MSFEEFVLEFQPHASWFYRLSQAELLAPVRLDAVVRVQHLAEDLARLPPITAAVSEGVELESLPRLSRTRQGGWSRFVTPELATVLEVRRTVDFGVWVNLTSYSPSVLTTAGVGTRLPHSSRNSHFK